jgi:hypothetical protein
MLYSPRERAARIFWIGTSWGTEWQRRPLEKVTGASTDDMCYGGGLRRVSESSYKLPEDARLCSKGA